MTLPNQCYLIKFGIATSYEKAVKTDEFGMIKVTLSRRWPISGNVYDSYIDVIGDKMGGDTVLYILLTLVNLNSVLTSYILSLTFPSKYFM